MLHRLAAAALLASLLAASAAARAEPAAGSAPATGAEPAPAKPARAPDKRRDPRGIKGISPFTEAILRGDEALRLHDLDGALAAYREALAQDPENALGHYRVGEVQLLKGDLQEAENAFRSGLRVVAAERLALKAKLQFALADLSERQKAYDEASVKWAEYEALTSAQKDAQGYPASGAERKKVVEAWKKLSADSAAVKARIVKGMQAADEAVRKSSK